MLQPVDSVLLEIHFESQVSRCSSSVTTITLSETVDRIRSTCLRAVSTDTADTLTSYDRKTTGCDVGRITGYATATPREAVSCTSPPPGFWGRVPLLIRAADPPPRISHRFPNGDAPLPRGGGGGGYHNVTASHLLCFPSRQHKPECLIQVRTPGRAMAHFAAREAHHCSPVPSHGTRLHSRRPGQSPGKQALQQGLDVRTPSLRRQGRLRSLGPRQQTL